MGLDIYFQMPEGQKLPAVDFHGLCNWSGLEYYLEEIDFLPGYTFNQVVENNSWLSIILEYENFRVEGSKIIFDYPVLDSMGQWEEPVGVSLKHSTKRDFATFRGGKYAALICTLTGISLFDGSCTPEQVKLIAYALNNTPYNPDWEYGTYTAPEEYSVKLTTMYHQRTHGEVMAVLGVALRSPVNMGKIFQSESFCVRENEYALLREMYSVFAGLGASTSSDY